MRLKGISPDSSTTASHPIFAVSMFFLKAPFTLSFFRLCPSQKGSSSRSVTERTIGISAGRHRFYNFAFVPVSVPMPVPALKWFRKSINRAPARARIRARKERGLFALFLFFDVGLAWRRRGGFFDKFFHELEGTCRKPFDHRIFRFV